MKINGPGHPPNPDPSQVEGAAAEVAAKDKAKDKGVQAPGGKPPVPGGFADKLAGVQSPTAASAAGVTGSGDPNLVGGIPVSDLAAELRSGKLTPTAAIDKVVERVLARQLGPDAPGPVRERIRMALQEAIESDPHLTEKLRQL